jgi:imipenem/basic amino acid-specific outer membrane pore
MKKLMLCGVGAAAMAASVASSADSGVSPFISDSSFKLLSRNFYFNRDYRQPGAAQSKRDEWAQGFIGSFSSGYTPGPVGFGVDAIGMLGLKLDSSSERIGSGLLNSSGSGRVGVDHAQDDYSKVVGAVKMRVSKTVLKYGEMVIRNPVFFTSDSRLIPETAEGLHLISNEIKDLTLEAGHVTSNRLRDQSDRASGLVTTVDFVGGVYRFTPGLSASVYANQTEDYWNKQYVGFKWSQSLSPGRTVGLDFNGYKTESDGKELGGELDNTAFSLKGSYQFGPSTVSLAYQRVDGTGRYAFGADGIDTNYLVNYIQWTTAANEKERSWQARYDHDFATLGVPGLTASALYVKGTNITSGTITDGKEWERDLTLAYVVQSGPIKGLSFKARQATYRSADLDTDIDEIRLITEYPLSL